MRGKYDADITELQEIIQHGVDAANTDSTWGIAFHKLVGNLPLGADSSEFSTRKRFAMMQLTAKMIQSGSLAVLGGLISLGLIWVGLRGFPNNWVHLSLGAAFLILIYFAGWQPFFRSLALYRGIKPLVQTTPDAGHELTFVAEHEMSRQFGKARLKSRILGLLFMAVSAGYCYAVYSNLLNKIPALIVGIPFFFFMGLGAFISGINKPEMVHRKGYAQARWEDIPMEMKLCLAMGVIASILGFLWVKGWVVL